MAGTPSGEAAAVPTETSDEMEQQQQQQQSPASRDGQVFYYSWSQPSLSFARRRYKNESLLQTFASIPSAFKEKENNNVVVNAVDSSLTALRWVARFFSIVGRVASPSLLQRPFI